MKVAAVVTAVLPNGRVNVSTGVVVSGDASSGNIPNVAYLPGYAPQVGDSVVIDYIAQTPYVCMCLTANRNTSGTITVANSAQGGLTQIGTVYADGATPPNLTLVRSVATSTPSSVTVNPVNSASWSPDWPTWRNSDSKVRQGDYGSGENFGLWFYGSGAFSALGGHTVTGVTLTITRDASAGVSWGPMQLHCYLHGYATMPGSGPPTVANGYDPAGAAPSLGQTVAFSLPLSWAQALQAGTAAGVGIASAQASDYLVCLGYGVGSISGQLVITYT